MDRQADAHGRTPGDWPGLAFLARMEATHVIPDRDDASVHNRPGGRVRAGWHLVNLRVVPVDLATAREFVAAHHRHHEPPIGHKFSVGVAEGDLLVGVAIIGRPVSRVIQSGGRTLEVIRSATDGTRNANSMLYGAARRATFALGYDRLITYTQDGESGASLRAAGYRIVAQRPARPGWSTPSRPRENKADYVARTLWETAADVENTKETT